MTGAGMTPRPLPDYGDLFAGSGWGVATQRLGLTGTGIELMAEACETRRLNGMGVIHGSVRDHGPLELPSKGLIASPPCQSYSVAGHGAGRKALTHVLALLNDMVHGRPLRTAGLDERTLLVLEPLRWFLEAENGPHPYQWVALEQVPTVLPVWHAYAGVLRSHGMNVVVGLVHAEQYGVPQTRKRAVLLARRDAPVRMPTPTHSRYHSRTPERLDVGVQKWVSMAEALDLACPRDAAWELVSNYGSGGDPRNRGVRSVNAPAPTVTSKIDRNKWRNRVLNAAPDTDLDWPTKSPSPTIRITLEEAALLQTFPPGHAFAGSKAKRALQVGNAVPPLLAEVLLRRLV